jgi:hypothetical protein
MILGMRVIGDELFPSAVVAAPDTTSASTQTGAPPDLRRRKSDARPAYHYNLLPYSNIGIARPLPGTFSPAGHLS